MLPTTGQLAKYKRLRKIRRNKVKPFEGSPQRVAIVYKIAVMTPRKPNSAKRTFAKVRVRINNKKVFAKIPGIGEHFLQPIPKYYYVDMVQKTLQALIII